METSLLALIARVFGFTVTACPMPATTFFAVQLVVAVVVRLGDVSLPPAVAWTISFLALGMGFFGAVLEWVCKYVDDVEEIAAELGADKVLGALSTFSISAMFVFATGVGHEASEAVETRMGEAGLPVEALDELGLRAIERLDAGDPEQARLIAELEDALGDDPGALREDMALAEELAVYGIDLFPEHAGTEKDQDLAAAIAMVEASDHPPWLKVLVLLAAVAINLGLTWLRGKVNEQLRPLFEGAGLERAKRILETGGVVLALVLIWLAPVLMLVLLVLTVGLLAATYVVLRLMEKALDHRRRRPCEHCGVRIRVEASFCPGCRVAVEPARLLVRAPKVESPAPAEA